MVFNPVRAVVSSRERRAIRKQRFIHPGGDLFQAGGIEKAFPHSGLIRNDDHGQPERRQLFQRFTDAGHKNELRPVQNVVAGAPAIDHAVSINEDRRPFGGAIYFPKENSQQDLVWLPSSRRNLQLRYLVEITAVDLSLRRIQQHFLRDLADDMARQDMTLLDSWRFFGRNADGAVSQAFHFATGASESDCVDRFGFCDFHGPYHIARISAGGNAEQDISFFSERFQLTSEDKIKAIIVSNRGQR